MVGSTCRWLVVTSGSVVTTEHHVIRVPAAEGEDAVRSKLRTINEELHEKFRALEEEFR